VGVSDVILSVRERRIQIMGIVHLYVQSNVRRSITADRNLLLVGINALSSYIGTRMPQFDR
jgi:hypothetical protein